MRKTGPSKTAEAFGRRLIGLLLLWLVALPLPLVRAQSVAASPANTRQEQATVHYFDSIRNQSLLLQPFLRQMPKGGDLHNHLSGAVYAETFIQWAAKSGLCIDLKTMALIATQCNDIFGPPFVSSALQDSVLYRRIIDAWSMRNAGYAGQSGHDQFFDTFGKFSMATWGKTGEMLAEVADRAAAGRVSYLEVMLTPDNGKSSQLAKQLKWANDFGRMREQLLANGMRDAVTTVKQTLNDAETRARDLLQCSTPQAHPGCSVTVRYIFQVGRAGQKEQVFAQMLAGFESALAEPRLVGLNLVQPEDSYNSMNDFSLHMRMLEYLHALYPKVHITLHAGELVPGLVPPDGLHSHIRESVEVGHAERIGHGVDIMQENDPLQLLREMAERHVMVEICLTSNDAILGVRGKQHPLTMYLQTGVPVALATDDEGVARSEMTREYLKAVEEQGLGYLELKTMARTSLEHAFIAGTSLWRERDKFEPVAPCAADKPGSKTPSRDCQQFLSGNEKAHLQWDLEGSLAEFESKF